MPNLTQYKTIDEFAAWLSDGLDRPSAKFLGNMLRGIYASKSIKLANVARALGESSSLHSTCNRLTRNLANSSLADTIADRLLGQGAHSVKRETRLIVHAYTLSKPHARKMQYLQDPARNQTLGEATYHVCEIFASNTGSNKYLPLLTTFWSRHAPGYVSDAQEILTALRKVLGATNDRGVVFVDSRDMQATTYDDIFEFLADSDTQFISNAGSEDRAFFYRQQRKTLAELVEICDLPYAGRLYKVLPVGWEIDRYSFPDHYLSSAQIELSDWAIPMEFGSLRARYQDSGRPISFIVLKSSHSILGESTTTMITSYDHLRTRQTILEPILSFISFTDVIAAHKTLRDSYNPSDLQVSMYDRMQLLVAILHAVLFFETRFYRLKPPATRFQPHQGDYRRDFVLPEDMERLKRLATE